MDRLTERGGDKSGWDIRCRTCNEFFKTPCLECSERGKLYDRLADYEDLGLSPADLATMMDEYVHLCYRAEEIQNQKVDGLLVELPFKYGDEIYEVYESEHKVIEWTVTGFNVSEDSLYIQIGRFGISLNAANLGKTIFRSREEAEKKLKEIEEQNKEGNDDNS